MNFGRLPSGKRPNEEEIVARDGSGKAILRYSDTIPTPDVEGNREALALYAGQSAGLIQNIKSAEEIVNELVEDTKNSVTNLNENITWTL